MQTEFSVEMLVQKYRKRINLNFNFHSMKVRKIISAKVNG